MFVIDSYIQGAWLTPRSFVASLATWAVVGVAFGWVMWYVKESDFAKYRKQSAASGPPQASGA